MEGGLDTNEGEFLVRVGVPEDELDAPWDWKGWTAGMVRRGIALSIAALAVVLTDKCAGAVQQCAALPPWGAQEATIRPPG